MGEEDSKRDRDDERNRDRSRRGDRQGGGRSSTGGNNAGVRERSRDRKPTSGDKRVYISNIAYEFSWQELKDLFRQEVGDVSFVKLFVDENDKPRGCGIVEFDTPELAKKAVQKMHRYALKDRKLVVKEDSDVERDKHGRPITGNNRNNDRNRNESRPNRSDDRVPWTSGIGSGGGLGGLGGGLGGGIGGGSSNSLVGNNSSLNIGEKWGSMYGLSPQFLEYLCINGPLVNAVFVANQGGTTKTHGTNVGYGTTQLKSVSHCKVKDDMWKTWPTSVNAVLVANLDFKVDQKKLKEVFKLAGRVERCELSVDKDGKSRGFGVVEYSHPVEAVQAISMLHNQMLFDRRITVRLDRADKDQTPRLPQGLKGIGMGLGSNGAPLKDVANNLPSLQMLNSNLNNVVQNIASAGVPSPFAAAAALGSTAASLGVGNQITNALGLAANAGLNLSAGVDRLMDSAARRPLGGASGIASLMGSGGSNNADLVSSALGGSSAFGGGIGGGGSGGSGGLGSSFGGGQLGSQNSFLNSSNLNRNYDESRNSIGGRSDFDRIVEQGLSSSLNNQNSDYTRRSNLGGLSQNAGNASNNSNQMTDAVLVRNLPPNVTWQQLKDKFSDAGNVTYAELRGKDTGLVQFSSQWEANRAINNFDRARWDGRSLEVRFY